MDPVSVLHDNVTVKFVQEEFCGFYFSVNCSQKQKSGSSDSRNSEVLEKLSLTDFPDTESSDWQQVSDPCEYCEQCAGIEEEYGTGSWEGVGLEISLEEIIPISGEHESEDYYFKYLWPLSTK